tara:strand:- start:5722 stop:6591 length:870 start_codon:yes stop_codon:yes gene_type:complete
MLSNSLNLSQIPRLSDFKSFNNLPKLDFGGFALLEYLLSYKHSKKRIKVLDIGGALGKHCEIMRKYGFSVDLIDKYEKDAELVGDFNHYNFKKKYDMIHCSHVIEHQRNQGLFLDKIYDLLKDNGDLVISGPKHPAERFVEGHIASTILPVFLQILIYSGFDCKNGKLMSIAGIENSFIVKKAKNFSLEERSETGFKWERKHQERSPIEMRAGFEVSSTSIILHNCKIFSANYFERNGKREVCMKLNLPNNYKKKGIKFFLNIFNSLYLFDSENKELSNTNDDYVLLEI